MSDSVQPHRQQPTRLPRPWDSPGKNPGVGCHFFLQCMKVKSEREVAQSCLTLRDTMDCSPPGSSIHGIFQARVLEWDAIAFSEKNIYFCFIDYAKAFDCVDHKTGKFWKGWEYQTILPASWEICMQVKKQQLEWDMEQWTGSKLGKVYIKAVYCHPASVTSMQSTSCEMPGWMKPKLESRLQQEISITSDTQMPPPLWQKVKRN